MAARRALIWTTLAMLTVVSLAPRCGAQAPPEEGTSVATLPPPTPHWALIYSLATLGSFAPSSVTIIDGDTRRVLGMMDGGLGSSFAVAPDHREFYMADTYYSRGARGDRTDVVTIYDSK